MISADVKHELDHFDRTMGQYIALSRRSAGEVVAQKGGQLLLGNQSPPFPGLFDRLRQLSPEEGEIRAGRLTALSRTRRGAKRPVKVRPRARKRAAQLLAGRPSGLFSVSRAGVRQVRFRKRGNRRITSRSNRGGRVRISRRRDAQSNESLLNRVSLGIALELMYRESGRGYVAISFLPKRYRRMLGKARAATRRNAQKYRTYKQDMQKALRDGVEMVNSREEQRNAAGDLLGRVHFATTREGGAALRIEGFTPPQRSTEAQAAVGDVVRSVAADTMVYVERKLARTRQDVGRFGKPGRAR